MLRPFNPHPLPPVPFPIHNNCYRSPFKLPLSPAIVIPSPPFAFPFDFGPFMLDSASEVLLKVADFRFGLTSSFAVSFKVVFFWFVLSQQLQYPAKEYPDYLLLFACSCYWCRLMGSVG
jgi:hypothetical protein